ncbi:uncharacterized protein LOC111262988 isoform X2 [Varroa jacobsoni]|uniref:uncharacterized protein LOC111262988 isoform X2 n=1 Tax=Varroa jacobsoni TaxID=62625 RepID=UPI000BF3B378|nr:uncharacterized protein LOC111262988 isoform X2 [Varroa jacobsoni]
MHGIQNKVHNAFNNEQKQVAQAKLWGPVYRPGHGWVYGEAGFVFVPRMPPYVPPIIFPPPRSLSNGDVTPASVAAVSERDVDSVVEPVINAFAASAPADSAVTTEKEPMKADEEKYDENKNNVNTKEP